MIIEKGINKTLNDKGNVYKFGVTDAGLDRYNQVLKAAPEGSRGTYSKTIIPKFRAHIMEKYLRSLHYASTGQWRLNGMKVPHPVNLNTGEKIRNPYLTTKTTKTGINKLNKRKR
jgi:hypothetical protein